MEKVARVIPAEGLVKKARVLVAEDFMTLDEVLEQVQRLRDRFGGSAVFYYGSQDLEAVLTYVAPPENPEEELALLRENIIDVKRELQKMLNTEKSLLEEVNG